MTNPRSYALLALLLSLAVSGNPISPSRRPTNFLAAAINDRKALETRLYIDELAQHSTISRNLIEASLDDLLNPANQATFTAALYIRTTLPHSGDLHFCRIEHQFILLDDEDAYGRAVLGYDFIEQSDVWPPEDLTDQVLIGACDDAVVRVYAENQSDGDYSDGEVVLSDKSIEKIVQGVVEKTREGEKERESENFEAKRKDYYGLEAYGLQKRLMYKGDETGGCRR